jgi:NAD-dependent SIR2 family protein deacetylase
MGVAVSRPSDIPLEERKAVMGLDTSAGGLAAKIKRASNVLVVSSLADEDGAFHWPYLSEQSWRDDPLLFFQRMLTLTPGWELPGVVEAFLLLLSRKAKLQRAYVDSTGDRCRLAGLPSDAVVPMRGRPSVLECLRCHTVVDGEDAERLLLGPVWDTTRTEGLEPLISTPWMSKPEDVPCCPRCGSVLQPQVTISSWVDPSATRVASIRDIGLDDVEAADVVLFLGPVLTNPAVSHILSRVGPLCVRALGHSSPMAVEHRHPEDLTASERAAIRSSLDPADTAEALCGFPGGFLFDSQDNYRDVFLPGSPSQVVEALLAELGWLEDAATIVHSAHERWGELSRQLHALIGDATNGDRPLDVADHSSVEMSPPQMLSIAAAVARATEANEQGVEPPTEVAAEAAAVDEQEELAPVSLAGGIYSGESGTVAALLTSPVPASVQAAANERLARAGLDILSQALEDIGGVDLEDESSGTDPAAQMSVCDATGPSE